MGRALCPGPTAVVTAPCPKGEQDPAQAPGHGWPPARELTKQHCSSLWDWKQLPVGYRQPDIAGTARAARGGQADTEHALLRLAQTLLVPTVFSWELAGTADAPQTSRGFLAHLPVWVGGFSPSWRVEPSVSLSVEPLLIPSLLFLAQQPRAVGFSVFFFFFLFFFPPSKFQIFSLFRLLFRDAACTIRL